MLRIFDVALHRLLAVESSDSMVASAMQYFFRTATEELKKSFVPKSKYKQISTKKSGILCKILPKQEIVGDPTISDVCLDLAKSSFCTYY